LRTRRAIARAAVQHSRCTRRRDAVSVATRNARSAARLALWRMLGALPLGLLRLTACGDHQRRRPERPARGATHGRRTLPEPAVCPRGDPSGDCPSSLDWLIAYCRNPTRRPAQHVAAADDADQSTVGVDYG